MRTFDKVMAIYVPQSHYTRNAFVILYAVASDKSLWTKIGDFEWKRVEDLPQDGAA